MEDIIGVRFTEAGAVSYCRAGDLALGPGDYVVVRTDRGERLGWVVIAPDQVLASEHPGPMRVVDRLASEADVEAWQANRRRAEEDAGRAQALAARSDSRVRVAGIEYDLAGEHCELRVTAPDRGSHGRLREQAADLFGADVQIEQVGDRDRAKAVGGVGLCGRDVCCATWMTTFPSISMKIAKEQGLAPNPAKISGICGRLLCCLSFEIEAYRELQGQLPKVGKRVTTPAGRAKVLAVNALTQMVRMRFDETGEVVEIPAAELRAQYGVAVRPADIEAEVEAGVREEDRERADALVAVLEPVSDGRGPAGGERGPGGDGGGDGDGSGDGDGAGDRDGTDGSSEQRPRRRRRRGRRGGRRRRGGQSGGSD